MKLFKMFAMILFLSAGYALVIKYGLFADILCFTDPNAFWLTVIAPLLLTSIHFINRDVIKRLKKYKRENKIEYYELLLEIVKSHKLNIIYSYIVMLVVALNTFTLVYFDKTAWGPSIAMFLVGSFYCAVQYFFVFDLLKRRFEFKKKYHN